MCTDPDYAAAQLGTVIAAKIVQSPIEELLVDARSLTATEAMGAVVTFEGVVRNHDGGHQVASLRYSHHPSAQQILDRLAVGIARENPEIRLWSAHRIGQLQIGDLAFCVIVASAHRTAAFAAATAFVDRVKAEVPIWKSQDLGDGTTQWVGIE